MAGPVLEHRRAGARLCRVRSRYRPEIAIKALMATYDAGRMMEPANALMDDLLRGMVTARRPSEPQLAAVLKQGRGFLGRSPPEWDEILERVLNSTATAGAL